MFYMHHATLNDTIISINGIKEKFSLEMLIDKR